MKNKHTVKFKCYYCGIRKERYKSKYELSEKHFCSPKCYAKYRRKKVPFTKHVREFFDRIGKDEAINKYNYMMSLNERVDQWPDRRRLLNVIQENG